MFVCICEHKAYSLATFNWICHLPYNDVFVSLVFGWRRMHEWILASLAGILNLGLALAIASGVITASVRPKAGQAPVFEGKPTFRTTPTPKMNTASLIASAVFVSIRRLGRVRPR